MTNEDAKELRAKIDVMRADLNALVEELSIIEDGRAALGSTIHEAKLLTLRLKDHVAPSGRQVLARLLSILDGNTEKAEKV